MDLMLKGKVAVVGGASKGLGRACAQSLAEEGVSLAICSRSQADLERAAQDIRKSDVFYHAALHAEPAERSRFLERAEFFHNYATRTLNDMPTRVLLRPIVVLLSSGFMRTWWAGQESPSAPEPAATPATFGEPEVFVAQKDRAKKRAVVVVAAAGAVMAAVVAAVLFR